MKGKEEKKIMKEEKKKMDTHILKNAVCLSKE